jgi:hypothetical protein
VKHNFEPEEHIEMMLYPELIAASFRKKEADLYIIWHLLREINNKCNHGSGHIDVSNELLPYIKVLFYITDSQAYNKIQEGIGKYWGKPAGKNGQRTTSLFSQNKIVERLCPQMIKVKPFKILSGDLMTRRSFKIRGWQYLRGLLVGAVASRFTDGRPVSHAVIQAQTGLSRSTVIRDLKLCMGLSVVENVHMLEGYNTYEQAYERLKVLISITGKNYYHISEKIKGKYYIRKRMANSYFLYYDRDDFNKRPKALRRCDASNNENCSGRIYYPETKAPLDNKKAKIPVGMSTFNEKKIITWQFSDNSHDNISSEIIK